MSLMLRGVVLGPVLVGLTLLVAGCGGTSGPPSVASVASSTPATAAAAPKNRTGSSNLVGAVAYAGCMRAHGVGNFPDPNSDGGFLIGGSENADPSHSPNYPSANKTCRHLLPNAGAATAADDQKMMAGALKYAQCMRLHGVLYFPDPKPNSGINLGGDESIDHGTPQFQAAIATCRSVLQGLLPGAAG